MPITRYIFFVRVKNVNVRDGDLVNIVNELKEMSFWYSVKDVDIANGNPDMATRYDENIYCQWMNIAFSDFVYVLDVGDGNPFM